MDVKYELFTKVNERRDIVDFVREVEKFPCLYNKTLPEYANKVHNRRAWSTIAKKANTSVADCRDKWRKIRISFMRSLKQQQSDKPPMRPYYLTEELHFLTPFLKIRSKSESEKKDTPKCDRMEFEDNITKTEISDCEISESYEHEFNEDKEVNRLTIIDNTISNTKSIENAGNGFNTSIKHGGGRNSYSEDIESNPRKMFLLSILPDIESLSEIEMRIFRREVINVVDNIINSRSIRN